MAEYVNKITNDMLNGRKIVLERSGLDVSKIDAMNSEYAKHDFRYPN